MKDLIVGTAGHIDHGKTALVRALTGIDTDRLEEEKRRGITIDIGFAHKKLGDYRIGFIDVPGHERFVKNMLSGIGGIQFLLLVVAADESIMPQTVEHFQICRLLEIPAGVIVITKKNQVDQDLLGLVCEEVRELVQGSFLEQSPICSVDSISGEGISELNETIQRQIEILDQSDRLSPPIERIFRLPVDRVFTVRGFGTVVTGTPQGGEIHQDETIAVYPGNRTGKIRGIQIFGEKTLKAKAGQRTALNLSGLDKEALERGMVLGAAKLLKTSPQLDVSLRLLKSAPSALRSRDPIRFHQGSGEILGRVYFLEDRRLEPGQEALAQVRLDESTVCFPGDHFILRRYSPLTTIGGGIVLDGNPIKWRRKDRDKHAAQLRKIESALKTATNPKFTTLIEYYVERNGIIGIDLENLASLTGLNISKVQELLGELQMILSVPLEPPLSVTKASVDALKLRICSFLKKHHQNRPLSFGASREELKERFLPGGSNPYFQFLLNTWQQEKAVELCGGNVAIYGLEVSLTAEQAKTRASILEIIEESQLNTPTLDEIVRKLGSDKSDARDILFYLLDTGVVLRISGDMVVLPSQLKRLEDRLKCCFPAKEAFTVSEFKELFSVSRKYAIPLLELLDRQKVTRRVGDTRVLI